MIRSLSPYYVTTSWVSGDTALTCTDYTLSIFIWDGAKAAPGTVKYTLTKDNAESSTGSDKVNISRLINDYIDFTPQKSTTGGAAKDGNNQWWVKTYVNYTTSNPADATSNQYATTTLFTRGYSYGDEGENYTTVSNNILLQGSEFDISRTSIFTLPILVDEAVPKTVTVISYPDNEINDSFVIAATTDSAELVKYIWVDASETTSDKYITITHELTPINLYITDEYKYTTFDVFFQNKDGGQQVITFFKERTDSMDVTDETYESDRGQPLSGNHQFPRYNVQGRTKLKLSSGYVKESANEAFKQLLLSERIWAFESTTFIPLNIESKSITYKTRQKERLINYEIDFLWGYNEINNV